MSVTDIKNELKVGLLKEKKVEYDIAQILYENIRDFENSEVGLGFSTAFREGREEWKNNALGFWIRDDKDNIYNFQPFNKDEPLYLFRFYPYVDVLLYFEIMFSDTKFRNEILNKFNRKYGQFVTEDNANVWLNNLPQNVEKIQLFDNNKQITIKYVLRDFGYKLIPRVNLFIGRDEKFSIVTLEQTTLVSPKNGTNFTQQEIYNLCSIFFNECNLHYLERLALTGNITNFLNEKNPGVIVIGIKKSNGESTAISIGRADMNKQ